MAREVAAIATSLSVFQQPDVEYRAARKIRYGHAESAEDAERMTTMGKSLDDITGAVVDAAYKLRTGLGPGLLESVYEAVLARDLERRGLRVEKQKVGAPMLKEGLKRIVNRLAPSASPRLRVNQAAGGSATGGECWREG
jgi:hypothetical protein